MANIELKKVEQQLNHRVLYSVKVNADTNHMEFPIGILDQGSATANETAVLTSALAFAEDTRGGGATPVGGGNASHNRVNLRPLRAMVRRSGPLCSQPEDLRAVGRNRRNRSFDLKSPRCAAPSSE